MALTTVPGQRLDRVLARDLTALTSWLESRQPRRAEAILVTGRPGFGKSLLTSQLAEVAQRRGWHVLSFAGSEFGKQSLLAAQVAEQLALPPTLTEVSLVRGIRDEFKRRNGTGRHTLLVVDGLEELNDADLGLLENLILFSPSPRLHLLLTYRIGARPQREESVFPALTRLQSAGALDVLSLEPMTEAEVAELCAEWFPSGSATPRFVRDLLGFSGGNPQWVQELIARILNAPDVLRSAVLSGSEFVRGAGLPAVIPRIVESRLTAYRAERFVAEALSVHAVPSSVEVLAELTARSERDVEMAIGRLEQGGVLAAFPTSGPWPAYYFTEPVLAAAVRVLMPRSTWFRLLKDSLVLSRTRPEVVSADVLRAAILRLDAADPFGIADQAVVLRAAKALIRRSRFESARTILTRMLERSTLAALPVSDETLMLLAESQARTGAREPNRPTGRPVESNTRRQVQSVLRAAGTSASSGSYPDTQLFHDRLLADESIDPIARIHVLLDAARLQHAHGHMDPATDLCAKAEILATSVGETGLAGLAQLEGIQIAIKAGRPPVKSELASAFARAGRGDSGTIARAASHVASAVMDRSSVPRALRWWRRAARLADRAGDYSSLPTIQQDLARAEIEAGEWGHAEQTIASAVHINASLHRMEELRSTLAVQRMLAALRGRSGSSNHRQLLPLEERQEARDPLAEVLDELARFEHHVRLAQLDEAEDALLGADAVMIGLKGHDRFRLIEVLPRLASLHTQTGDPVRLREVVKAFDENARYREIAVLAPLHDQARANLLALTGDPDEGIALLQRAAVVFGAMGFNWRSALAYRNAATWSRRAGLLDEAKAQLQAAFDLFYEMDAATELEQIRVEMLSLGGRVSRRSGAPHATLTVRQRGIAELAARGLSDSEIAATLGISPRTVSTHMHRILKATGLRSRTQLGAWLEAVLEGGHPRPRSFGLAAFGVAPGSLREDQLITR